MDDLYVVPEGCEELMNERGESVKLASRSQTATFKNGGKTTGEFPTFLFLCVKTYEHKLNADTQQQEPPMNQPHPNHNEAERRGN